MKRLEKVRTVTVDDLLRQDDVIRLIGQLTKERAKLTGMVVTKLDNNGKFQILSTFDVNDTMAILTRSLLNYALDERLGQLKDLDD